MPLVSKSIPNLIGGVSQQPDTIRFDNQCEAQDNAYPAVLEGLTKRPPSEHVVNMDSSTPGDSEDYFVHVINRDPSERYAILIKSDESAASISVHPLDGSSAPTVTLDPNADYLKMASSAKKADTQLRAITIADYTFLVNRSKTVAMDTATTTAREPACLFYVRQGDYGTTYTAKIKKDGVEYITVLVTPDGEDATDRLAIDTNEIALRIEAGSSSGGSTVTETGGGINGVTGTTITRFGSVIHVFSTDDGDFDVSVSDGLGGNGMVVIKDEVQRISDLPPEAPNNFTVKVVGDATDTRDDYYVEFVADDGGFGSGYWREAAAKGIEYKFDYATMPHVLIRQADGNFRLAQLDGTTYTLDGTDYKLPKWGERAVGDADSNGNPTFAGKTINDVFLFKNRLGFLADENVILSETSEFFNFWRTTVTDLLPTDPIDVASTHSTVSILTSAIPFAQQLVLFSDQTQFVLQAGDVLTPTTVSMTKTTNYESLSDVRPVTLGNSIYFGFTRGDFTGIRQYYIVSDTEKVFAAADISDQIPQYLAGNLRDMSVSSHENVLCILTDSDRRDLYVYKFYDRGEERLQSSWSRFRFSTSDSVLGIEFVDTTLYIVVKRTDGIYLDKMRMESGLVDTGSTYRTLLDRRTDETTASRVYDSNTGLTTITLPYKAYTGSTIEVITKGGRRIPVATQTNGSPTITVAEDISAVTYWIGEQYEMVYEFSDLVFREPTQTGGTAAITEGRFQIRYITLSFTNSGFFKVVVTPDYRDASTYPFTGRILGAGSNLIGSVPIENGNFRVPVYSKSDQVKIEIKNDTPLPCALVSAEFEATLNARSQRYG
jgi:hypothetical protein